MHRADFHFELPPELIAQEPAPQRSGSRLLHLPATGPAAHGRFADLPQLLRAGDLLVVNDTRVIKARLHGEKSSGGKVEVLVERLLGDRQALAQVRASKPPRAGGELRIGGTVLRVEGREGEFYRLALAQGRFTDLLEQSGHVPLPPYIERADTGRDRERYQTVFARAPGAVAAPTAGLHFDEPLLAALAARGIARASVTLHVGAGTFQPVRVQDLAQHRMHAERYEVPAATVAAIAATRAGGGRVVAVGTTVVRALESACRNGEMVPGEGETRIFITPGHAFRAVDLLVTNFHLPESTLLMLVCAFGGTARVLDAYRDAVAQRYRFFSYGDAMLLERAAP